MLVCLMWAQVSPRSVQQTCRNCLHLPYTIQANKEPQSFLQSNVLTEHGHLPLASAYPSIKAQRQKIHPEGQCGRETSLIPFCNWETYLPPHWNWRKGFLSFFGSHCSTLHWIITEWLSQKEGTVQGKRVLFRLKLKMLKKVRWPTEYINSHLSCTHNFRTLAKVQ